MHSWGVVSILSCSRCIRRLRWAPDGLSLASASDDRTVRLWDLGPLFAGPGVSGHMSGKPSISAASSAGQAPAAAASNGTAEPRLVLRGHSTRLWDVAFADGGVLVTASEDCTARCRGRCARASSPFSTSGLLGVEVVLYERICARWTLQTCLPRAVPYAQKVPSSAPK